MNINSKLGKGFTLIELLVVFSVLVILSVVGIASFVDYSRTQTVQSATNDLVTMLQVAKSRAQSQAVLDSNNNNMCGSNSLTGYEVNLCNLTRRESKCISQDNSYELHIVCGGSNINANNPITRKKFPTNIVSFDPALSSTTATSFLFHLFTGGLTTNGGNAGDRITITGYNDTKIKQIQVDPAGNIWIVKP